jgi:zinc transporter ZupT
MTSLNLARAMILAVAEAGGAYWFFKTKKAGLRTLMTSFGLGFAVAIVLFDLLPDSTEHFAMGYALFAVGAAVMLGVSMLSKQSSAKESGSVAVTGMALHNLGEGILLAAMSGPISFMLFAGALLHKLPEGMATFALLDGAKEKTRFALAAGMILVSVSKALFEHTAKNLDAMPKLQFAMPCLVGAVIGGVSCLIA